MKDSHNKHGLSRDIPKPVAREVRKRCGFGCVVCGEALAQYDHHSPEFKDATKHRAEGIALLCPTHHTAKGNGMLSTTAYHRAIENPKAVQDGGAQTSWESSEFAPQIVLGNVTYQGGTSILAIDDSIVLGFSKPEEQGGPPQLDLTFFDRDGNEVFKVEKNIINANSDSFDVEQTGRKFTIRSGLHKLDLKISFYPPTRIVVEQMSWHMKPWGLEIDSSGTKLLKDGNDTLSLQGGRILATGPLLWNCKSDGSINSENMTLEGLGQQSLPYESLAKEITGGGIVFPFPVWLLVNEGLPKPPLKFTLGCIAGTPVLPIFTQPELATRGGSLEGFQLRQLGKEGLLAIFNNAAPQQGLSHVAIDPAVGSGKDETLIAMPISSLVESLTSTNDDDIAQILRTDSP